MKAVLDAGTLIPPSPSSDPMGRSAAASLLAALDAVLRPGRGADDDRCRDGCSGYWSTSQHDALLHVVVV
jgi:hypothetical protein